MSSEPLRSALRSVGVEEMLLSGEGADFEKWEALFDHLAHLKGSPVLDAVKEELRVLGCCLPVDSTDAGDMWREVTSVLSRNGRCPTAYLADAGIGVALVPTSPLDFDKNDFYTQNGVGKCRVLPLFSPDDFFATDNRKFISDMQKLSEKTGVKIQNLTDFCAALESLLDDFVAAGCPGGFHSILVQHGFRRPDPYHAELTFHRALTEKHPMITPPERALLFAQLMRSLSISYQKRGLRLYLIPPTGTLQEQISAVDETEKIDTVCGVNAENGFVELFDYLEEYRCLPQAVIGLSPATPYGILRSLSGRFAPLDGEPRILWGIDGERATAADVVAISRAIRREGADNAFVGVLRDAPGFLTAPVTRMLAEQER